MTTRFDPLTGNPTVVVGSRQHRPNQPDGCPFCVGGIEAPEPYRTKAFVNRWPSLDRDRCEVVLFSPDHDASLSTMGADAVAEVVDLWAERTGVLGSRPDVSYVLVFENRGAEVGATIQHPHGQIFAWDFVPPVPAGELARAVHACPLCTSPDPALVVASAGDGADRWSAWVPEASTYPYGLVLAPQRHDPDLVALGAGSRRALAALLADALGRLDRLFDAPMPYMMWFHQRPTDGGDWPQAHVHAEVAPLLRAPGTARYVAGAELGSGVAVNPLDPLDAAAALREA